VKNIFYSALQSYYEKHGSLEMPEVSWSIDSGESTSSINFREESVLQVLLCNTFSGIFYAAYATKMAPNGHS
jgi:hypothetical protein